MSHAALLSGKYESVYYNDICPLLPPLIQNAIDGKYNYNVFKPEFITKEEFQKKKDTDGYVKFLWSFGSRGQTYIFGQDVEELKHATHDFIVFGKWSDLLNEVTPKLQAAVTADNPHDRRTQYLHCLKAELGWSGYNKYRRDAELHQLERLQKLEQLGRFDSLTLNCGNMYEYEYRDGDIVYIDPPYEDSECYDERNFNHTKFYDWVYSRPYQVWFSSYDISDKRFSRKNVCELASTFSSTNNARRKIEYLYSNKEW